MISSDDSFSFHFILSTTLPSSVGTREKAYKKAWELSISALVIHNTEDLVIIIILFVRKWTERKHQVYNLKKEHMQLHQGTCHTISYYKTIKIQIKSKDSGQRQVGRPESQGGGARPKGGKKPPVKIDELTTCEIRISAQRPLTPSRQDEASMFRQVQLGHREGVWPPSCQ